MENSITRTFDLLNRYGEKYNKVDAFGYKRKGVWEKISSQQYIDDSHNFAYGLLAKGFKKGDKIATVSSNRPEWNIVDMGMAMLGIIHVPIFNTLSSDEYSTILEHCEAKVLIVSDSYTLKMLAPAYEKISTCEHIYSFDEIKNTPNWLQVLETGKLVGKPFKDELEAIKASIKAEDFASLIYTSGTTGQSKGVMLSHKNLVQNFMAASKIFELKVNEKFLSILPLCHVGGRMGNYQTQYSGTSIYYAENMASIAKNMKEIQPDGFDAVPRILEKIYDTIISKGNNLTGFKKKVFFWAVDTGLDYRMTGLSLPFYRIKLKIADKMVFSKWREAIGGKVRIVGCGGASLQPRLERVFWACGIKILNMYGLTETSPIITINRIRKPQVKLGSVGCLIDGVQVKIADDGEILCKGHNVMLGYYKDTELTKAAFDKDGWFYTGDIGRIEKGGFLKVTDRKKEIFKLSNGKYVAPQSIENQLKESVFIDQVMVVGEHEKFASALISPNFSYMNDWCNKNEIRFNNKEELINMPPIIELFNTEIKNLNKKLSGAEKILRYRLVPDEWSPNSGELSPTLKLRRKFIDEKYQAILQEVYVRK